MTRARRKPSEPEASLIGPDLIDLRRIISQRIAELGWTIEKASARAGFRPQDLSAYLNGNRGLHIDTALRLLLSLGMTLPIRWSADPSTFPVWEKPATPEYLKRMAHIDSEARRVENALARARMSQVELSVKCGVHTSQISRLLTRRSMPGPEAMAAINRFLQAAEKEANQSRKRS